MNDTNPAWRSLALAEHESTTCDDHVVRLQLALSWALTRPGDPPRDLAARLQALAALASQEYVASSSLDDLLENKDTLVQFVRADLTLKTHDLGVVVGHASVRELRLAAGSPC